MPFDEEELNPHGECAAEIVRLGTELTSLRATNRSLAQILRDAAQLIEEYSCKTEVGHIATDCERVVERARRALSQLSQ